MSLDPNKFLMIKRVFIHLLMIQSNFFGKFSILNADLWLVLHKCGYIRCINVDESEMNPGMSSLFTGLESHMEHPRRPRGN